MIRTNEEFEVVRKQLSRIQNALLSMRDWALPKNKRNYQVLVEGYVDQIDVLQADIDAYLRIGLEPVDTETAVLNGDTPNHRSETVPDVDAVQR